MSNLEETLLTDIYHKTASGGAIEADGDLQSVSGLANIKEALLRRLVTSPGSLAHRPNYGVGIIRYHNSLSSVQQQRQMAVRIKEQFELDTRVEEVTVFKFEVDDNTPALTTISITLRIKGFEEQQLEFNPFREDVFNG